MGNDNSIIQHDMIRLHADTKELLEKEKQRLVKISGQEISFNDVIRELLKRKRE